MAPERNLLTFLKEKCHGAAMKKPIPLATAVFAAAATLILTEQKRASQQVEKPIVQRMERFTLPDTAVTVTEETIFGRPVIKIVCNDNNNRGGILSDMINDKGTLQLNNLSPISMNGENKPSAHASMGVFDGDFDLEKAKQVVGRLCRQP